MKQRIEYIDAIKGLAIFLMVMGHAIAWNYDDYNAVCNFHPEQTINVKMGGAIWQLIYSFHMPLFFMVSGFLMYKAYQWSDFLSFTKKKIIRLLLPYICTIWLVYLVRGAIGYWFLLCLFQISIVGFLLITLLEKINPKRFLIIDIIIMGIVYVLLRIFHAQEWHLYGISLGRFVGAFIPFFVGILLRKHKFLFNACIYSDWFYSSALILFVGVFSCRYLLEYGKFWEPIYIHSTTFLAIMGLFIVFHIFAKDLLVRFRPLLSHLGRMTLPIYMLHIMFVIQIPAIGEFIIVQNAVTSIVLQIIYSAVISIIAIVLSLLLYKVIIISPHLKRLFFGE